jgi:predicted metalloprotease with PDZ domain
MISYKIILHFMRLTFFIQLLRRLLIIGAVICLTAPGKVGKHMEWTIVHPAIHYWLKVDAADFAGYKIEMHLHHVPHHFQLAMATHHEYDDRFWRFVRNFHVDSGGSNAIVMRTDSALWDITIPGGDAVVSYNIQLPVGRRFAHQPFLSSYGGLVGDIHSFLYLVGKTQIPSTVTFELPEGWQMATGLERTTRNNTFIASSAKTLMDCPVLAGYLHQWNFTVEGIPYTVAYLPVAGTPAFDTALLVANVQKIVAQTVRLFGGTPYKHYTFLLEDGVGGALEHANSVTIGAPANLLANHMQDIYEELAHEFSHTWNLMSMRPGEYTDLNCGPQERSAGLWFSEGLAMFYADLLVRRAGLPCEDSTRTGHLESLIGRYYADTGNTVIPPAAVSLASNAAPGMLGDYSASVHLQGELLGAMLDLVIRDATRGARSFDDVMRLMYKRFCGKDGFYTRDIEQTVKDVCGSDEVHPFFQKYIYEGKAMDFNPYLRLIGLRLQLYYRPAMDDKGHLAVDGRLYIWQPAGDTVYHLVMTDPRSCWVKAGLHTGDALVTINGQPIKNRQSFNDMLKGLTIGDRLIVEVDHSGSRQRIPVDITGYEMPVAHLINEGNASSEIQKLSRYWKEGR